jgi:hypothetical protein
MSDAGRLSLDLLLQLRDSRGQNIKGRSHLCIYQAKVSGEGGVAVGGADGDERRVSKEVRLVRVVKAED